LLAGNKRVFLITICIYDESNPLLEKREVALESLIISEETRSEKKRKGREDLIVSMKWEKKICYVSGG
jgi:hypothetical protein